MQVESCCWYPATGSGTSWYPKMKERLSSSSYYMRMDKWCASSGLVVTVLALINFFATLDANCGSYHLCVPLWRSSMTRVIRERLFGRTLPIMMIPKSENSVRSADSARSRIVHTYHTLLLLLPIPQSRAELFMCTSQVQEEDSDHVLEKRGPKVNFYQLQWGADLLNRRTLFFLLLAQMERNKCKWYTRGACLRLFHIHVHVSVWVWVWGRHSDSRME